MNPSHCVDDCLVPWKRLWLPLDKETKWYAAGEGFLEDWDDIFGFRSADGPKQLDELLGLRCLILCGEPGMGKSKALELHRPQIEEKARQAGDLYWRAFREAINPEHLLQDLKGSSHWQKWVEGGELTVVIDGVDEGLALAAHLVSVLTADLRDKSVARLRLILVSRDAEWPLDEGRALMGLWPSEQVGRFQLQRLRFTDAEQAARHWGLSEPEAAAFLSAVLEKSIESFAARPMTLRMLVDEFKADRQLSGTRAEIFRRACLRLCKEDPARAKLLKKSPHYYEFTAEQILPTVKKAASWMLFGRFSAVSRSPSCPQHLDFERLVPLDADDRQRANVEAALGCALFCDAGSQSRTFAHQSYAEYLAAEYLSEFPLAQVLNLVCIHDGPERFIVPQLAELAAWLALRHEDFADWLIEHEPEILLRNDASSLSESRRGRFVSRLLERMEHEQAFDDWDLRRFYASFRHAGLAEQLRPYLVNRTAGGSATRAAIHLAGLGKLGELFEELLAMAKDVTADSDLRGQAMDAVCGLIPSERLSDLEPFALCEAGPDPRDRLRAAALRALVPRRWRVSEAFLAAAKPSNLDAFGEFNMVCASYLPEKVDVADLPVLLRQLTEIDSPFHGYYPGRSVACRALVLAAGNLDKADVAVAFLNLVKAKLQRQQLPGRAGDPEWKEAVEQNESVRRQIAALLADDGSFTAEGLSELLFCDFIRLQNEDCPWLLHRLETAPQARRPLWVILARSMWPSIAATAYRDDFFEACQRIPELGAKVGWPCAILLDSAQAKRGRESWGWQKRREQEAVNRPRKPTPQELFEAALTAALADWRQWHRLSGELQRGKDGSDALISPDPTSEYRWRVCTEEQRAQVIRCARDFLINATPFSLPNHREGETACGAFWALWLTRDIIHVDSELRAAVMSKWFESLFAQPFFGGAKEEQELTSLGVALDPSRAGSCLRHRLERALQGKCSMTVVLSGFELAWAPPFTPTLLVLLDEHGVSGMPLWDVIRFLAGHDSPAAQSWLDKRLNPTPPANAAMILAMALALFPASFWAQVKGSMQADPALALSILQLLADFHASSTHLLEKLDAAQLGDLFLLLEDAFPTVPPLKIAGADPAPRERIERLRAFIPERLQALASDEACQQLKRLADAVPHWATQLRWRFRNAHLALLRRAWRGVPVDVIEAMSAKRESRWVRSADDLLELVMDSISRFQVELNHTDFPQVRDLWNENPKLRPKHESALTQKLVRWLRDDLGPKNGVALGCEVEPSSAHKTDIQVWGRLGGAAPTTEQLGVTIEVKCSFNREVATSLKKQLVGEYLLKLGGTHGIYVVGWYRGEGWKPQRNGLRAQTWAEATAKVAQLLEASRKAHRELRIDAICLDCEFPQAFRNKS